MSKSFDVIVHIRADDADDANQKVIRALTGQGYTWSVATGETKENTEPDPMIQNIININKMFCFPAIMPGKWTKQKRSES